MLHGDAASGNSKKAVVVVAIRSNDRIWANRALAEVEEQIERTWLPYTAHLVALLGLLALSLIMPVLGLAEAMRPTHQVGPSTMWLEPSDLQRVEPLVSGQRLLTEQESREVSSIQLRNVLSMERSLGTRKNPLIRQSPLVLIPLIVIIACAFVLLFNCYPRAVFLWGDEQENWKATLRRRTLMWSIIGSLLIGGLVANAFYSGVTAWFSGK